MKTQSPGFLSAVGTYHLARGTSSAEQGLGSAQQPIFYAMARAFLALAHASSYLRMQIMSGKQSEMPQKSQFSNAGSSRTPKIEVYIFVRWMSMNAVQSAVRAKSRTGPMRLFEVLSLGTHSRACEYYACAYFRHLYPYYATTIADL